MDFLHQKLTPVGQFRFLSPKNPKTRTNRWKTHNLAKTQISAIKTQISAIKNPDSGAISHKSNEILIESSEISSNLVRLRPNLAKSHRFQWDFRRIWVFLTFSRNFLAIFLDLWCQPTHPSTRWSLIHPTRSTASEFFQNPIPSSRYRVGHKSYLDRPVDSPTY